MDSLVDKFIEFANWEGSREEAQTYIEASNGSLELALSFVLEGVDPKQRMRANTELDASTNGLSFLTSSGSHRNPPLTASQLEGANSGNLSLREEMNEEYTRDLVRKVAPLAASEKMIYQFHFPLALPIYGILDIIMGKIQSILPPNWFSRVSTATHNVHFDKLILPEIEKLHSNSCIKTKFLIGKSYRDALEVVKTSCEYLLVVVTSESHQTSPGSFVSQLLSMAFTKRDDVKIWCASAQTVQGLNLVSAFGVRELPFFALLSPSPKTAQSSVMVMENIFQFTGASLSIQKRRESVDSSALEAMEQHEPKLLALKLEHSRFDADRQIREEQDMAYQNSLELDRKKAEAAEARRTAEQLSEVLFVQWATRLSDRVLKFHSLEPSAGARVCLRFPDGHRLNTTVPGNQPVSVLYDLAYFDLHPNLKDSLPAESLDCKVSPADIDSLLEQYDPPYGFSLISTLTRNALSPDRVFVKDVACVWPSGVFMVDLD